MQAKDAIHIMETIEEDIPLASLHSEDARYNWPERWCKLRDAFELLARAEKSKGADDETGA